jgi:hypothetical protein
MHLKEHHLDECKKLIPYNTFDPYTFEHKTNYRECKQNIIGFFCDYEPKFLSTGDCFLKIAKDYEIVYNLLQNNFKRDVYKFQGSIPNYENTNWIYEAVYRADSWLYCIKTPLSKIVNCWNDYENKDKVEAQLNYDWLMCHIRDINFHYLIRQEFVSKRFNHYSISISDVNTLLNKLNKQTNGINQ